MKKFLIYTTLIILVATMAVGAYFYRGYQQFLQNPVFVDLPVEIEIEKGSSYADFISLIQTKRAAGSKLNWKLMARFNDVAKNIRAGEFVIDEPYTPRELLAYIAENNVKTYSFTFIEGHQWQQIKKQISSSELKSTLPDVNDQSLMDKLGISASNLEGQFLPETYQFTKGDVDIDVLQRAHQALLKVLQQAWENRDASVSLKSPYELLILASIIEKETAQHSERNIISGVFHRRLKKGMKLQTDPTVIYGVGAAYAGDITSDHLRTDTPYNTYTRTGLPPTPIAMASAASIEAAAHPNQGRELYFVANNQGGHTFSETYEEHKQAVAAYLRGN